MIVESGKLKVESEATRKFLRACFVLLLFSTFNFQLSTAQNVNPRPGERIFVRGGIAEVSAQNRAGVSLAEMTPDSLYRYMAALDSVRADGIRFNRAEIDSIVTALVDRTPPAGDSLDELALADLITRRKALTLNSATVRRFMDDPSFIGRYIDGGADTLISRLAPPDTLSRREKRRLARLDSTAYRHSAIFRDSMRLSPTIAISLALPGFSQLYNKQYWKIPVLYGTVAAGAGIYAWQTKLYKPYRQQYDRLIGYQSTVRAQGAAEYGRYMETVSELQAGMIRHNTYRQLALGFAAASYMYFLVDGTLNHPGTETDVKKATTLALVFPGAGQLYNQSYWKVPIVIGGFSILAYTVNWNNKGYQRYKLAYEYRTDDNDGTVDEFDAAGGSRYTPEDLLLQRRSFRRNRDLCMIFLGLFYIMQVVDAHATAHMKAYDVSDDLSRLNLSVEPMVDRLYSHRLGGEVNTYGISLGFRF